MAETKIYIPDALDARLRELAMKRFGYGRGSISGAVEEAIVQWLAKNDRINSAIRAIVSHAKKDRDVLAVVVFGSYARKEPGFRDVDIGIILKEKAQTGGKHMKYMSLIENDDRFFDLSIINELPLDVRVSAINNGVFVYVSEPGVEYDYARRVLLEWSDFKPRLEMLVKK